MKFENLSSLKRSHYSEPMHISFSIWFIWSREKTQGTDNERKVTDQKKRFKKCWQKLFKRWGREARLEKEYVKGETEEGITQPWTLQQSLKPSLHHCYHLLPIMVIFHLLYFKLPLLYLSPIVQGTTKHSCLYRKTEQLIRSQLWPREYPDLPFVLPSLSLKIKQKTQKS